MGMAGYTLVARIEITPEVYASGQVVQAVSGVGAVILGLDVVDAGHTAVTLDITCLTAGDEDGADLRGALEQLDGCAVQHISDTTFSIHVGGKLEVRSRVCLLYTSPSPRD